MTFFESPLALGDYAATPDIAAIANLSGTVEAGLLVLLEDQGMDTGDADACAQFLSEVIRHFQPHAMEHLNVECFLYGVIRQAAHMLRTLDEQHIQILNIVAEVFGEDVN